MIPYPFADTNAKEVIYLRYNNLHDLVSSSRSTRKYFLSLPVELQKQLDEHNEYIHCAADLYARVDRIGKHNHAVMLSESLDHFFK